MGRIRLGWTELASAVVSELRSIDSCRDLERLVDSITREMDFRFYALAHHADLKNSADTLVNLKAYPEAIFERLVNQHLFRRTRSSALACTLGVPSSGRTCRHMSISMVVTARCWTSAFVRA